MTQRQNGERRVIVLFDMDWTLVDIGPAHSIGTRAAFEEVYGRWEPNIGSREATGRSMSQIFAMRGRAMGLPDDVIQAGMDRALAVKGERTAAALEGTSGWELPGAAELVRALVDRGYAVGMITGTEGPTARALLRNSVLGQMIDLAASGDEEPVRADMLRLAVRRMIAQRNWEDQPPAVIVLGDSPRDAEAARELGARAVLVGTGFYSVEELEQADADAVLPSFADWEHAAELISQLAGEGDAA